MSEDQDAKDSHSDSGSKTYGKKSVDKKAKPLRPLTKIILRRLPPTMTEEAFLEQVSPIPEHDFFYFSKPDPSLGGNFCSRAYINFVNVDDIYLFRDKFDGYVFLDDKGVEYVGIVEYAPFQRIPKKKKKKDPKCGTIESDPIYQEFLESLSKEQESDNQPKLEYSYPVNDISEKKVQTTPLLEYLAARKQDKRGRDERRRRENDKRKMRIERKGRDLSIKCGEVSEDENNDFCYKTNKQNIWYGEQRMYHKTKFKDPSNNKSEIGELKTCHGSEEVISTDSDWDTQFPALTTKTHNTFTLTSMLHDSQDVLEVSKNSGGDTILKEEDIDDGDVRKIKSRDWDNSTSDFKDDQLREDYKEGSKYESRAYRKIGSYNSIDKRKKIEGDKKSTSPNEEDVLDEVESKKDKFDKIKESPREQKSKKYSDTRKERIKLAETPKSDKQAVISKMINSESKGRSMNHDDIKPFTQLPHVKTDDLTKMIENIKLKADEQKGNSKETNEEIFERHHKSELTVNDTKKRRNSLEPGDFTIKEENALQKQKSLDDRSRSVERQDSDEKEKSESTDCRTERRIRNKDRPSLVIYQPGMGKLSKQRMAKDKEAPVNESEKKDT
ncbi:regulator of nonsense transcripts 3A isoform X1 [Leptidea sinapis]|uniref:regulator of nonsense transcripts 3A isoform X1 n=1 Tax=Leptidea sinapis TaxID=189913 RepID=UPI002135882F|nr:regulator of nonsense transcripts 3A isoform X1 [Leptidea sinapis]